MKRLLQVGGDVKVRRAMVKEDWSFLSFEWNPLFLSEDYMCAVGYPSRVSRKGKTPPLERGRGKHSLSYRTR